MLNGKEMITYRSDNYQAQQQLKRAKLMIKRVQSSIKLIWLLSVYRLKVEFRSSRTGFFFVLPFIASN